MLDIGSVVYPVAAMGSLGLLLGLGLGFAGRVFAVREDERLALIRTELSGANCGGCGFAGCEAFAAAVVSGEAKVSGCPVGGAAVAERVAEVMGVTAEVNARKAAFVKCGGSCSKAGNRYEYVGISDCRAAAMLAGGGSKSCSHGCVGGGSCVRACPFDAIAMEDGVARVDREKCAACGVCVVSCPHKLIELTPYGDAARVSCNSKDAGKQVRAYCSAGCIACKMCVKACGFDAIRVEDNLARIDYDKCTGCGACATKCPVKVITVNTNLNLKP